MAVGLNLYRSSTCYLTIDRLLRIRVVPTRLKGVLSARYRTTWRKINETPIVAGPIVSLLFSGDDRACGSRVSRTIINGDDFEPSIVCSLFSIASTIQRRTALRQSAGSS